MKGDKVDLGSIVENYERKRQRYTRRIMICAGTGCVANGSLEIQKEFLRLMEEKNLPVDVVLKNEGQDRNQVSTSGCQGFCQMGPLVEIRPDGILYVKVKKEDVEEIINQTIIGKKVLERLLYRDAAENKTCVGTSEINFYNKQKRTILKRCGLIDPDSIEEYISLGGYRAAELAYKTMTDEDICQKALKANLRGRGGGGFPAGRKWDLTRIEKSSKKFIICNGDEGDPGAFMDRSLLEGTPHSVIEGMMIAAKAIGAHKGYVYVRMEYPLAVKRIRKAIEDARKYQLLGKNIFGCSFDFDISVMEGAGAFVCGEETALMASIEGKRGMPMPKPPFPAQKGLFGHPTVINNVETLATVPFIFSNSVEAFTKLGTSNSPGTKTFALTGHVANTGLIEVPFGATLRQIIFDIGGGVTNAKGEISNDAFKAVQIGGPSGGCLTHEHLDLPLDFDSVAKTGAIIGSGGLVVMNKSTCMVKIARFFMKFTQEESCGKCVLCREGTKQMLKLLDDIIDGKGTMEKIALLEELSHAVAKGSLCGLGKTAPNPVLSTLRYFRDEYIEHVVNKNCPARECQTLCRPSIIAEKCMGCTVCAKKCPVGAIEGEKKGLHRIIEDKCINCRVCISSCKFGAIA